MEKIVRTITQYRAEDGTLFCEENNCIKYEKRLRFNKIRQSLKDFEVRLPDPIVKKGTLYASTFIWYHIESDNVYHTLCKEYRPYLSNCDIKISEYICLELTHNYNIVNCFTIEETLEYVNNYIKELETARGENQYGL